MMICPPDENQTGHTPRLPDQSQAAEPLHRLQKKFLQEFSICLFYIVNGQVQPLDSKRIWLNQPGCHHCS